MTVVYVERPLVAARVVPVALDSRSFWVESLDGTVKVPFDDNPVRIRPGALGLEEAPVDPVFSTSPGVEGGFVEESPTTMRRVLLPLGVAGSSQSQVWDAKRRLREVIRPGAVSTSEGTFKLVCSSASGVRELTLVYLGGLEGTGDELPWWDQFAVDAMAPDPFARDRVSRSVEFSIAPAERVMVSSDPAAAGERGLSSSVVIGENMPVDVNSEVPVWPRMDFTGPFDSLTVSTSTGTNFTVPNGVDAGSTLTIVTSPRAVSIRLDGDLAAGLVARTPGRKITALRPDLNVLNVAGPGATEDSRIVLSWRGGFRSLY